MAKMRKMTYVSATEKFIEACSEWLTPIHAPAVTTLRMIAAELDTGVDKPAPLIGQYNLAYRNLLKSAPQAEERDPIADLIRAAQAVSDEDA